MDDPSECPELDPAAGEIEADPACGSPAPGVVDWSGATVRWAAEQVGDSYAPPAVGRLVDDDGDGAIGDGDRARVAAVGVEGRVWLLEGATGEVTWSVAPGVGGTGAMPALGDLDGDGLPEVVVAGADGVFALRGQDGSVLWEAPSPTPGHGDIGGPVLADLDADGVPEVILGRRILRGDTGALRGEGPYGTGGVGEEGGVAWPAAADLDGDGTQEVVVGNAAYAVDGTAAWHNGEADGRVAVADFDADGAPEIVVVVHDGEVRLQAADGTVRWTVRTDDAGTEGDDGVAGAPVVADFDGDGLPEIGSVGRTHYVVLDGDGSILWRAPVDEASSGHTGSVAFDFDGDGAHEIVHADEQAVRVFDGRTGAIRLESREHASGTAAEAPAVADVDGDGDAEIVYASAVYGETYTGVRVLDVPGAASTRPTWSQVAWTPTAADDSLAVPASPAPSWITYNTFRTAELVPAQPGVPDAVPVLADVCAACAAGEVRLGVAVGNAGTGRILPGALVAVDGAAGELVIVEIPTAVPGGRVSPPVPVWLDAAALTGGFTLRVVADTPDCNPDNDTLAESDPCG